MKLYELLEAKREEIISEAYRSLERAHLKSYASTGNEENMYRLTMLFDITIECIEKKNLQPIIQHSESVSRRRYEASYDLHEVHTAFNVLEESLWKRILHDIESDELGDALGTISTILGAGKETLALTYVNLVSKSKSKSLNLSSLFSGR